MTRPLPQIRTVGDAAKEWLANMLRVSDKYIFNKDMQEHIKKEISRCRTFDEVSNIEELIHSTCKGKPKKDLLICILMKKAQLN